jgi:hypothetical protein
MFCVYKAVNIINKKVYVGFAEDFKTRKRRLISKHKG